MPSTVPVPTAIARRNLDVQDLSTDILVLIFSLLHGQDIARCTRVCRSFAELICSDLRLQYRIELAQNGMVDGELSTLPISERQERLREYSSRFRDGTFDHEDLAAHPHYSHQLSHDLPWNTRVIAEHSQATLYSENGRSGVTLSLFNPGFAQAGIQSGHYLIPIGTASEPGLVITQLAIDGAQDLLVMGEKADMDTPEEVRRRPDEVYIRFYSLSESKTLGPTPHPAATLPSLQSLAPVYLVVCGDLTPKAEVVELHIAGDYVILELSVVCGEVRTVFVETCNWRTGKMISSIDVGALLVNIIPLDYPYLLVIPKAFEVHPESLAIYNFSPAPDGIGPNRRVCTLELPEETLEPGESIRFHLIYTGDRPQTAEGHFLPDRSHSLVVLTFIMHLQSNPDTERNTHLIIPRSTLLAAVSQHWQTNTDATGRARTVPVPWVEWGPQGCLRLRSQRRAPRGLTRSPVSIPLGSRFPLAVFDDYGSEVPIATVYVFDVNPLAARWRRQVCSVRDDEHAKSESGLAATIIDRDDIEKVLPGVVDPDCSKIPWVAYCFRLPYNPKEWPYRHVMDSVVITMTGFTIQFGWVRDFEKTSQTWTV